MPSITSSHPSAALAVGAALCGAASHVSADCIDDAALRHRVNALVLRAIGWQESHLRPEAIVHNANGSIDIGAFQINSVHLPTLARHGIARTHLIDGCVSAEVAAWHYRRQIDELGDSWQAIGAYHSRTSARGASYANRIAAILRQWRVMPPGPPPFPMEQAKASMRVEPGFIDMSVAAPAPTDLRLFDEIAFAPSTR